MNLLDLSFDELRQMCELWEQPAFRAAQIWRWLYAGLVADAAQMTNLPKTLRDRLSAETSLQLLTPVDMLSEEDGLTQKALLQTADGQLVETVLMRYPDRNTACISSQIGCPVGCVFCATGQAGFSRDLSAGEIVAQVLYWAALLRREQAQLTNVVFMGMGEPLLNREAVWRAILNLNHPDGLALGWRRFTISTVGIVPGIEQLAQEATGVGLAVSLHAPDNVLRNQLVPINTRYPLERLVEAVRHYTERTGRRVTFEYALIEGVNDSDAQARRTVELLRGLLCHVNLIPANATAEAAYRPARSERVARFQQILRRGHIQTTVRIRRGDQIEAACGQLRGQHLEAMG